MTAENLHDALGLLPSDLITAADKVRSQPRKAVIHWHRWVSMAACIALILFSGLIFMGRLLPGMGGSTMEAAMEYALAADCAPQEPAAQADTENAMSITGAEQKQRYSDLDTITLTPTGPMPDAEEGTGASASGTAPDDVPVEGCTSETAAPETGLDLAPTQYVLTPTQQDSSVNFSAKPQTVLIQSREALDTYYAEMRGLFSMESFYESCRIYDEAWFETHDLLVLRLGADCGTMGYEVTGFAALENYDPPTWEITLTQAEFGTDLSADTNAYWHILLEVDKDLLGTGNVVTVIVE